MGPGRNENDRDFGEEDSVKMSNPFFIPNPCDPIMSNHFGCLG
jgi:hypothetical protein